MYAITEHISLLLLTFLKQSSFSDVYRHSFST